MKKIFFNILLAGSFSAFIFTQACDDTITAQDIDSRVIPDADVSFQQHIQPVFELKCNTAGCHNDQDRAGGLSFTTWANTTADVQVVFPGDPTVSKLVWSIERTGVYPMPPNGYWPLTTNQIEGIKTWIKEGAKNN